MIQIDALTDEQGKGSLARILLVITTAVILAAVIVELGSASHYVLSNTAWAALVSVETYLIMWAGGARVAQYISPVAQGITAAVASAVRDPRLPSRKDDERGT